MPQIGQFTRNEDGFVGHLTTLLLTQDIVIVAAEPSDAENAPQYRVHVGGPGRVLKWRIMRVSNELITGGGNIALDRIRAILDAPR